MDHIIVDKVFPPNKLIESPYGTLCRVENEEGVQMYIQVCEDEKHPLWISIGDFLSQVFHNELYDKEFIEDCLKQYKGKR